MNRILLVFTSIASLAAVAASAFAAGDAAQGARVYRACVACHSLQSGVNMTGPSLAGVFGRKAGSLASFLRYSDGLRRSGVTWNEDTLDAWLHNPEKMISGNYMGFPGIQDAKARADLIAYLKVASQDEALKAPAPRPLPDLKNAPQNARVTAIRHCRDTYFVTVASGETTPLWEFNVRFKTDSSENGPLPGQPVVVGGGMQGDRAQVVFSNPREISGFVKEGC